MNNTPDSANDSAFNEVEDNTSRAGIPQPSGEPVDPAIVARLEELKAEKDAVILAHYYAVDEIQQVADYIGDSFYLATLANSLPNKVIVLAGVYFMAESAKILNPDKIVLIPDVRAGCPMADMVRAEDVLKMREKFADNPDDLAVVCYVNSNADVKALSDVCVTSSNAVKIVSQLKAKNFYFIPDKNLGRHIAAQLAEAGIEKNFIEHPGFCCVHEGISRAELEAAKAAHPGVQVLAHPECRDEVLAIADYIGSTSGILEYTKTSPDREFIIATEEGILTQMKKANPDKQFYLVNSHQFCRQMKKNNVTKIIKSLETLEPSVFPDAAIEDDAKKALAKMVELA